MFIKKLKFFIKKYKFKFSFKYEKDEKTKIEKMKELMNFFLHIDPNYWNDFIFKRVNGKYNHINTQFKNIDELNKIIYKFIEKLSNNDLLDNFNLLKDNKNIIPWFCESGYMYVKPSSNITIFFDNQINFLNKINLDDLKNTRNYFIVNNFLKELNNVNLFILNELY